MKGIPISTNMRMPYRERSVKGRLFCSMRQPAAVEGFLSPTPEKEIVNQWLRQDKDDFTYQTLAILQRRGIASPWASAIGSL